VCEEGNQAERAAHDVGVVVEQQCESDARPDKGEHAAKDSRENGGAAEDRGKNGGDNGKRLRHGSEFLTVFGWRWKNFKAAGSPARFSFSKEADTGGQQERGYDDEENAAHYIVRTIQGLPRIESEDKGEKAKEYADADGNGPVHRSRV